MKHQGPRVLEAIIHYRTQYPVIYCPVCEFRNPLSGTHSSANAAAYSVSETIQGGTDSNSTRKLPDANSAHHFDENKILPEPLISSRAGSAESDSTKPQSLQSDITQVGEPLSDHSYEDFQASN